VPAHLPCCVDVQTVVIGRRSLCLALEAADEGIGANVIAVKGERGTGKSWSRHAIATRALLHKHPIVDLEVKCSLTCEDVMRRLLLEFEPRRQLGARDEHPGVRWGEEVGIFVASQLPAAADKPSWIIIDGCAQASAEVREMLLTLGTQVKRTRRATIRLCLLGFDANDPLDDSFAIDQTRAVFEKREVRTFFAEVFARHAGDVPAEVIDEATEIVFAQHLLQGTGLRTLHDLARDAVRLLFPRAC
jgi:hypothetical protein